MRLDVRCLHRLLGMTYGRGAVGGTLGLLGAAVQAKRLQGGHHLQTGSSRRN